MKTSKPLHKDPSFWIVVVVVGVTVNALQIRYGLPWFQRRLAQVQPAPRVQPDQARDFAGPDLDWRKKTHPWQKPRFNPQVYEQTPPQIVLMPSEYESPSGGWGTQFPNGAIGIRMGPDYVVQAAYSWSSRARMVIADSLPQGYFDFFAKSPGNARDALQAEIKKQWGVIAERESHQTNVLIVKLDHREAPGLKPGGTQLSPQAIGQGSQRVQNASMSFLTMRLESWSKLPVLDQTGLTDRYDFEVPSSALNPPGTLADEWEHVRTVFLNQFGLDLIRTNAVVELLVVKKAKL